MIKKCSFTKAQLCLLVGLMTWCVSSAQQSGQNTNNVPSQVSPKQGPNLFFGLLVFNIGDNNSSQNNSAPLKNEQQQTKTVDHPKTTVSKRTAKGTFHYHKQTVAVKRNTKKTEKQLVVYNCEKSDKPVKTDLFARDDNNSSYVLNVSNNAVVQEQDTNNIAQQTSVNVNNAPQQTYTYGDAPSPSIEQYLQVQKESLRKDNILANTGTDSLASPLPYAPIFASEALYRARVWRLLNTREAPNAQYFYSPSVDENSYTRFINIIINAMRYDSVQAFSAVDDRFTTPITFYQALTAFGGVSVDSIYKYQIKEEWVFNNRDGKSYVRILGIAPIVATYNITTGSYTEAPAFWIYYPDLRKALVRNIVANPLTGGLLTWESIFEDRLFTSRILHSTIDAQNGFTNAPLTEDQGAVIQDELNNLGKQSWVQQ